MRPCQERLQQELAQSREAGLFLKPAGGPGARIHPPFQTLQNIEISGFCYRARKDKGSRRTPHCSDVRVARIIPVLRPVHIPNLEPISFQCCTLATTVADMITNTAVNTTSKNNSCNSSSSYSQQPFSNNIAGAAISVNKHWSSSASSSSHCY